MSTPRLMLKQPTGWFAAGREFAQAITLLSDGAFKLYVYACLHADRHTGCLRATVEELARAVETTPTAIAMNVDELQERAVCCVRRHRSPQLMLEIRDRFWPYQRQPSLNALLGQRQSSSRKYATCCWLLLAFRPASQPPMKSWPSTCIDVAFPCNRSRGPSCSDVPASMSPCLTPEHERRSPVCNTSPTSSRKSTTRRFRKATGSRSDRRWCGWNNDGSKEIKQELDAANQWGSPGCPASPRQRPTSP